MPKKNKQSSTAIQKLAEKYASSPKKPKNVIQKFSGEDCYHASKLFAAEHAKNIPEYVNIKSDYIKKYIQGVQTNILLSYIHFANPSISIVSSSTKYIQDTEEKKKYIENLNEKLLAHDLKITNYDECIKNIKADNSSGFVRKLECVEVSFDLILDYLQKCNKDIFKEKGSKQIIFNQIFINKNVLHNIFMLLKYQDKFQKFGFNVEKVIPFLDRKDCANIIMLGLDDEKFEAEFNKTSSYDLTNNFCKHIQNLGHTILHNTFKLEKKVNAKLKIEGDPIINAFLYAKPNENRVRIGIDDCKFICRKVRDKITTENLTNNSSATYRLT